MIRIAVVIAVVLGLILLLTLVGCSKTTYDHQLYDRGGSIYKAGKDNAWFLIGSTHTKERSLDRRGPPYYIVVFVHAQAEHTEPLRVLQSEITHQGKTIEAHARSQAPLESGFVADTGSKHWEAKEKIPLGKELTFVEGSTVTGTVVVELPYAEGEVVLKGEFTARSSLSSGTAFDALMGV